jgi:hypothetical protein
MPKGPRGEKRKADVIGNAVLVMRIATGEIKDTTQKPENDGNRRGGVKGGKARAVALDPETRSSIAKKAARARWGRDKDEESES